MATILPLKRELAFEYGELAPLSPLVRRIVARNPSPYTLHGTGTYVIGHGRVAVIDPGPDDAAHFEALVASLAGETVTHILVTHTHLDHSPLARPLAERTGAPVYAFGPHGAHRHEATGEAGADFDFNPDVRLADGERLHGDGWTMEAVHTPGHTSNHLCYALCEERLLFTGDHVMGWSTSVVSPPDGDMGSYVASLEKLLARDDRRYWPTHGPAIEQPHELVRAFIAHRREREASILDALAHGEAGIDTLVARIYVGLDERLVRAAGRSVLAHLIDLHRRGVVDCGGAATRDATYRLT